jgi:hypothetical protein
MGDANSIHFTAHEPSHAILKTASRNHFRKSKMLRAALFVLLPISSLANAADNCEPIRARIEAKISAAGVTSFSVAVFESAASAPGQVVGTCDSGTKKIIYSRNSGSEKSLGAATVPLSKPSAQLHSKPDAILTECKDGTVSMGGSCKK